ncbi:unnamed protein product [Brassica oleracea var. botrytis]
MISASARDYTCLTAHFIDDNFNVRSWVLGFTTGASIPLDDNYVYHFRKAVQDLETIKIKWAKSFTGSKNPLPESEEAEQNRYQKILDPPNKSLALWFRLRLGSSSRWSPLTCRSGGLQNQSYSNRSSSHQHLGNLFLKNPS